MKQELILCPNCGAQGIAGNNCEFCGSLIPLPVAHSPKGNSLNKNERIVARWWSKNMAIAGLIDLLGGTKTVSPELFDDIEIAETRKYLVPFYFYEGTFEAPWSCVKIVEEEYKIGNETKIRTKRYPMNGIAESNFCRLYCACNLNEFPESLREFVDSLRNGDFISIDALENRELDADEKECLIADNGKTQKAIWKQYCGDYEVEELVSRAVHSQFPSKYEDGSWSYSSHTSAGVKIHIPIWSVTYTSKGKKYAFVSDGFLTRKVFEFPADEDFKKEGRKLNNESGKLMKSGEFLGLLGVLLGGAIIYCAIFEGLILLNTCFICFCFCLVRMRFVYQKYAKMRLKFNSLDMQHELDALTGLLDKVILPNKFGLDEKVNVQLLQNVKDKISAIEKPSLREHCTWVRRTIITFFIIVLLVNIFSYFG